jgi:hypothetical protein
MNLKKHYNVVIQLSPKNVKPRIRFIISINRLGDYIGEKRAEIIRKNLKKSKDFKPQKYSVFKVAEVLIYSK